MYKDRGNKNSACCVLEVIYNMLGLVHKKTKKKKKKSMIISQNIPVGALPTDSGLPSGKYST